MNTYELEDLENEVIYKDELSSKALAFLFCMCLLPIVAGVAAIIFNWI
jgi:hypothetical protein